MASNKNAFVYGLLFLTLLSLCFAAPAISSDEQSQAQPPGAQRPQNPNQKEIERLQAEIEKLQARVWELRSAGSPERYKRDLDRKKEDDELIAKLCQDARLDYRKITYRSNADNMEIPAYLFLPLQPRGPKGHPALVWVHGGVASSFSSGSIPLIRQAIERGYIVIAPDFRGSTGYGEAFQEAIDYGGSEIDDTMTAIDYLKANVPQVDPDRIGMIGWSHGGFITLHSLARDQGKMLKCGYAGVPVTNLVFRLSYKGPGYAAPFVKQKTIGGEPWQKNEIYIQRSPIYHVDKIKVPVMVHVATNDQDVNFVEDQMMIYALRYHLPYLAQTKIYVDPPGGHSFDRLVNKEKTALQNTPAQRDSLNLVWAMLEENLKPYLGVDGKVVLPN
jgi:dipeptidyl aminopeptidase/acylaminoacyl peptidase